MLKALYVIAIGLLFAGFIGFGVTTFYPAPTAPSCTVEPMSTPKTTTPGTTTLRSSCQWQEDNWSSASDSYQRNLSMIFLLSAVIVIAISIFGLGSVNIIGDGITLGGVILLFVSLASTFASSDTMFRFTAVTVCLAVILFLSYWKFVRAPKTTPPTTL